MPSLLDDDNESLATSFELERPFNDGRVQPELLPRVLFSPPPS
jgi:hypothetical protein